MNADLERKADAGLSTAPVDTPETLRWIGEHDGFLRLIDQTLLPGKLELLDCHDVEAVWEAIRMLRVRGAPAIGIAAAYGFVIGMQNCSDQPDEIQRRSHETAEYLASSRPTAVNLFWAIDRMKKVAAAAQPSELVARLLDEAKAIHEQDRQMCRAIGAHGAGLLANVSGVLTHCNAGGLATAEYGTALSVFFTAQDNGHDLHVFIDETRPLLQGARLTAWELMQRGIRSTLICDSMAGQVMKEGKVQAVVTGADRIAANGDSANKIGTYSVAVLARAHNIPFYVAAPTSTFDLTLADGSGIPIEEREAGEITRGFGKATAPDGVNVYNPAFDVTPAELIRAIITDRGVIEPVSADAIAAHFGS